VRTVSAVLLSFSDSSELRVFFFCGPILVGPVSLIVIFRIIITLGLGLVHLEAVAPQRQTDLLILSTFSIFSYPPPSIRKYLNLAKPGIFFPFPFFFVENFFPAFSSIEDWYLFLRGK